MDYSKSLTVIVGTMLLFGVSPVYALSSAQLAHMSSTQKKEAQQYFRAHDGEFSTFKKYHPGPYWILANKQAFHLTTKQIKHEEQLKDEMAVRTITDNRILQQAYRQYARDAAMAYPPAATIKRDTIRVGKAKTQLAWEMVPYHLKGYALLTTTQKAVYAQLAAKLVAKK
ncbi:MAG: hypothetical protein ACYCVY_06190 [Acidiferrobacteraceae bacterium]